MAKPTDYLPTIEDYFKHEFDNTLRVDSQVTANVNGQLRVITRKVYLDIHTNAKFASFYIPPGNDMATICTSLARLPELALAADEGVETSIGSAWAPMRSTNTLVFTNKVILYADAYLSADEREQVLQAGNQKGVVVELRDRRYADDKATSQRRDAFISFDWRNRNAIARPLAIALCKMLCPVWYSDFVLRPGDNIRESIEKGLKECKKCIVIISKEYLANPGWAKTEFDSVFTRERLENSKVIIPIWYRVTPKEVYEYCPSLSGIYALKWVNKKYVNDIAGALKPQIVTPVGAS